MTVYVIVRKSNRTCGHGDHEDIIQLVRQGSWENGAPHPAFTDPVSAQGYIDRNGLRAEVLPLEVQKGGE